MYYILWFVAWRVVDPYEIVLKASDSLYTETYPGTR